MKKTPFDKLDNNLFRNSPKFDINELYEKVIAELGLQQSKRDQLITIYLAAFAFIIPPLLSADSPNWIINGSIFIGLGVIGFLFSLIITRYRIYKEAYWLCCRTITVMMDVDEDKWSKENIQQIFYHCMLKKCKKFIKENGKFNKQKFFWNNLFSSETLYFIVHCLIADAVFGFGVGLLLPLETKFQVLFGIISAILLLLIELFLYYKELAGVYKACHANNDEKDKYFTKTYSNAWFLHFFVSLKDDKTVITDPANFTKAKDYLICVDSDGCAMDTMDIKHIRCFGPCMIKEWALEEYEDILLKNWNNVNLYTMTRGINRFKGLAIALSEVDELYQKIDGVKEFADWVKNASELSNAALEKEIKTRENNEFFKKALSWSKAVNESIKALPESEVKPFNNVKEALKLAHEKADIAIVSSANLEAVLEEWERFSLLEHTDIVLSQNVGSKAFCISELLKKGYDKTCVLMCGDAPGDMEAANKNDVFFYPILVKKEADSWQEFMDIGLENLISNKFGGEYANKKTNQFLNNLGGK